MRPMHDYQVSFTSYRGYTAIGIIDFHNQRLVLQPVGLSDSLSQSLTSEGQTVQEVCQAFERKVEQYLAECSFHGIRPETCALAHPEPLVLSSEEFDRFIEDCNNPPEPTEKLRNLMKPYWDNRTGF